MCIDHCLNVFKGPTSNGKAALAGQENIPDTDDSPVTRECDDRYIPQNHTIYMCTCVDEHSPWMSGYFRDPVRWQLQKHFSKNLYPKYITAIFVYRYKHKASWKQAAVFVYLLFTYTSDQTNKLHVWVFFCLLHKGWATFCELIIGWSRATAAVLEVPTMKRRVSEVYNLSLAQHKLNTENKMKLKK